MVSSESSLDADFRDALPLAPTSLTIKLPKPGDLTDLRPNCERFNLRDRAKQLEMHEAIVPKSCGIRQREKIGTRGVLDCGA